ncbi:MAG TPA: hypothetical protein VFZ49_05745 [Pyrinomonadaceae bacterium]
MRASFDVFLAELARKPGSKGLVYSHGTETQIRERSRYFQDQLRFRGFDPTRINFVSGRNIGSARTDMWLVPKGAAPPEIKPEAWIASEFGRVYKKDAVKKIEAYFKELWKLDDHQGYIINYGTPAQIALRELWIRDTITFRGFDPLRLTLVNGGPGPQRTVMWFVPPGAENPTP